MLSFFTLYASCDILVPVEKYEETYELLRAHFCCFNVFVCLFLILFHHLFWMNMDERYIIYLLFLMYQICNVFLCPILVLYETVQLLSIHTFCYTPDIKRLARMALHNTWSICCFMGQTSLLKMPQGTLHFTFQPCTIRQVWKRCNII